jgi:sugar diacid utilization regulator
MGSARRIEDNVETRSDRGAASAAPRPTPLTIVSAAVAGGDLRSIARSAATGSGAPIAIALPALGPTVVWPEDQAAGSAIGELDHFAAATIRGEETRRPPAGAESVPIRIGNDTVGIVAAIGEDLPRHAERLAWLEAAAAAAAVTALIHETKEGDAPAARRSLLQALALAPPRDADELLNEARRLGCDLAAGAVAICGEWSDRATRELPEVDSALLAELSDGHVVGLVPSRGNENGAMVEALRSELERRGLRVAMSVPRTDPAALHDAIREADVMLALADDPDAMMSSQEETYRLLIGVLLRDPAELEALRVNTISALERYDDEHDTDLLATLRSFLAHHGSTTETAEAMQLHRHTVGYRLTRVQEVSGLSPYESDGRERLSLGLKAHRILIADRRRAAGPSAG